MAEKNIGEIIRQRRNDLGVTVENISVKINIPVKYLLAIEENDFANLPSRVYVECFLKKYGRFLSLNVEELFELYHHAIIDNVPNNSYKLYTPPRMRRSTTNFLIIPKFIKLCLVVFVVLILSWYIGKGLLAIMFPPALTIYTPSNNMIFKESSVVVSGATSPTADVYVNDAFVLVNDVGEFNTELYLQQGINIIKISVRSRHGKERIEYRKVLVNDDETVSLSL